MQMQWKMVQLDWFLCFLVLSLTNVPLFAQTLKEDGEDVQRSQFPDGFLFGTSTSSYQIEGAYLEDGKGLNTWDVFSHIPGKIQNNDNGDIADNHYHMFLDDIALMHSLGVKAYRFSISWTRILPRGRFGEINQRGIMFYDKLIDNLLLKGIEPFVTIHHFDVPQELEEKYGGWLSPLMQEDFLYLVEICFKNFGHKVKHWMTLNEPNLFADMAYLRGKYPPGHCSPPFGNCSVGNSDREPLIALHNMILGHAKAVKTYREHFQEKQGGSIGIVVQTMMYEPFGDNELDWQAATRSLAFVVAWLLDPIVHGDYPSEMRHYLGEALPSFSEEEIKYLKGSADFIGINHYSTLYAKDCIHSACPSGWDRPIRGFIYSTGVRNGVLIGELAGNPRFFVVPRGMEKIVNYVKERYDNMPMFITENGYSPPPQENEPVEDLLADARRIQFLKSYLAALARAIRNGADVRGYFVWSLIDNFEWVDGYSVRYGLYHVDRQTLKRIPKHSAKWYRNLITNVSEDDFATISLIGARVSYLPSDSEAAKAEIQ